MVLYCGGVLYPRLTVVAVLGVGVDVYELARPFAALLARLQANV